MLIATILSCFCFTTVILKVDQLNPVRQLNRAVVLAFVKKYRVLVILLFFFDRRGFPVSIGAFVGLIKSLGHALVSH